MVIHITFSICHCITFRNSILFFFFLWHVCRKQTKENQGKVFWSQAAFLRPRSRNEWAEAEKCSPRFPFVYWSNSGNSNQRSKLFPTDVSRKNSTECFFHFSLFFRRLFAATKAWYHVWWKVGWKGWKYFSIRRICFLFRCTCTC